ncbi:MAG: hypothetical protein ACRDSZ_18945 [Pseudonocardiaceae bacterium]
MTGKHRRGEGRGTWYYVRTPRAAEVVDAGTLKAHLMTLDALAAGRRAAGRYVALCGADVLPAALVTPPRGTCPSCRSIPSQRSGASRSGDRSDR